MIFLAMRSSWFPQSYAALTAKSRHVGTLVLPERIGPVAAAGAAGEVVRVDGLPAGIDGVADAAGIGEELGVRQVDDELLRAGAFDRTFTQVP